MVEEFDVIVIGGGSAGISAIEGARAAGAKRICLIEATDRLGGECPYSACVPTKALLKAARLYQLCKYEVGRYGIHARRVSFDFAAMARRKEAVVNALTGDGKRLADYVKKLKVTVKRGEAQFVTTKTIEVAGQRVKAEGIVIATGAKERLVDMDGIDEVPVWFARDVVKLRHLPKSIIIIGGGPIGSEFSTLFSYLGVQTTVLQHGSHILSREDADLAALAEASLRRKGATVLTNVQTLGIRRQGRKVSVTYQIGRKPRQHLVAEACMIAAGRAPHVEHLAVGKAKIVRDQNGWLKLNDALQTSSKHIFAAGDVTGRLQFTGTAHHEGFIAGWNAVRYSSGELMKYDERVVPRVTFIDPELAAVGLTAAQAKKLKLKYTVKEFPVGALGRAAIDGMREGLLKIIVEKETDQVLGAHLLCERAGEIIHELALAMQARVPYTVVASMIHAYPTWSESIPAAQ